MAAGTAKSDISRRKEEGLSLPDDPDVSERILQFISPSSSFADFQAQSTREDSKAVYSRVLHEKLVVYTALVKDIARDVGISDRVEDRIDPRTRELQQSEVGIKDRIIQLLSAKPTHQEAARLFKNACAAGLKETIALTLDELTDDEFEALMKGGQTLEADSDWGPLNPYSLQNGLLLALENDHPFIVEILSNHERTRKRIEDTVHYVLGSYSVKITPAKTAFALKHCKAILKEENDAARAPRRYLSELTDESAAETIVSTIDAIIHSGEDDEASAANNQQLLVEAVAANNTTLVRRIVRSAWFDDFMPKGRIFIVRESLKALARLEDPKEDAMDSLVLSPGFTDRFTEELEQLLFQNCLRYRYKPFVDHILNDRGRTERIITVDNIDKHITYATAKADGTPSLLPSLLENAHVRRCILTRNLKQHVICALLGERSFEALRLIDPPVMGSFSECAVQIDALLQMAAITDNFDAYHHIIEAYRFNDLPHEMQKEIIKRIGDLALGLDSHVFLAQFIKSEHFNLFISNSESRIPVMVSLLRLALKSKNNDLLSHVLSHSEFSRLMRSVGLNVINEAVEDTMPTKEQIHAVFQARSVQEMLRPRSLSPFIQAAFLRGGVVIIEALLSLPETREAVHAILTGDFIKEQLSTLLRIEDFTTLGAMLANETIVSEEIFEQFVTENADELSPLKEKPYLLRLADQVPDHLFGLFLEPAFEEAATWFISLPERPFEFTEHQVTDFLNFAFESRNADYFDALVKYSKKHVPQDVPAILDLLKRTSDMGWIPGLKSLLTEYCLCDRNPIYDEFVGRCLLKAVENRDLAQITLLTDEEMSLEYPPTTIYEALLVVMENQMDPERVFSPIFETVHCRLPVIHNPGDDGPPLGQKLLLKVLEPENRDYLPVVLRNVLFLYRHVDSHLMIRLKEEASSMISPLCPTSVCRFVTNPVIVGLTVATDSSTLVIRELSVPRKWFFVELSRVVEAYEKFHPELARETELVSTFFSHATTQIGRLFSTECGKKTLVENPFILKHMLPHFLHISPYYLDTGYLMPPPDVQSIFDLLIENVNIEGLTYFTAHVELMRMLDIKRINSALSVLYSILSLRQTGGTTLRRTRSGEDTEQLNMAIKAIEAYKAHCGAAGGGGE